MEVKKEGINKFSFSYENKINIPKQNVNEFLTKLWDIFEINISKPTCYHTYFVTENPEIYCYNVHWANELIDWEAKINFFNSTANGLNLITIYSTSKSSLDDISHSIQQTVKEYLPTTPKKTLFVAKVPVITEYELSGNYKFEGSILGIEKYISDESGTNCYLHVPISEENNNEQFAEITKKSYVLVSILTVATQNIFTINENDKIVLLPINDYEKLETSGRFHRDNALIDEVKYTVKNGNVIWEDDQDINQMIIEERDCIKNNMLGLPNKMQKIFDLLRNNFRLEQSCNRYLEGLTIRKKLFNGYIRGAHSSQQYMMSYELIAYVSSIEALLDTYAMKESIKCPKCETEIYKEEWKIKKKFISFVEENSERYNFHIFKKVFSQLYDDRSLFVHTGHNLIHPYAIRSNRPLIIKGKNFLKDTPEYYSNIHEYVGYLLRKNIYSNFKQ